MARHLRKLARSDRPDGDPLGRVRCLPGRHVRVNGGQVKPAHAVRAGDEVRLRRKARERVVVIQRVITKRAGAPVAAGCVRQHSREPTGWLPAGALPDPAAYPVLPESPEVPSQMRIIARATGIRAPGTGRTRSR
jgi:ribosome-associated heat shock protein Hsp15